MRRGEKNIVKASTAVPGALSAFSPVEIVQADHTKADIFVVDEEAEIIPALAMLQQLHRSNAA